MAVSGLEVGRVFLSFLELETLQGSLRTTPPVSGVDGLNEVLKRNHFWSRNWNKESPSIQSLVLVIPSQRSIYFPS